MNDTHNLERFIKAQEHLYQKALKEIKNGKKCTHWMFFIFPQIVGLDYLRDKISPRTFGFMLYATNIK